MKKIIVAKSFTQKLIGLMGKRQFDYGLLLLNVNKVHTFFMKVNIDIIGLDSNFRITEIYKNIPKNKLIFLKKSKHVLEVPTNNNKNYYKGKKIDVF